MDLKIFITIAVFCVGGALAQSCVDTNANCKHWPVSYCQTYKDYMKKNCPQKCGYCQGPTVAPVCDDQVDSKNCANWKSSGYCATSSQYYAYMKSNCKKTCGLCGTEPSTKPTQPTQPSGSCSASQRLQSCSFVSDTCDFIDVPFDDNHDFVLQSSGGQDSQGGYLSASGRGQAHLILPLDLVLPHQKNYGNMCMQFYYRMSSGGSLLVHEVENSKNYPKKRSVRLSGPQSSWKLAKMTFEAAQFNHLLLQATPNSGKIDIDNVRFCDGSCN